MAPWLAGPAWWRTISSELLPAFLERRTNEPVSCNFDDFDRHLFGISCAHSARPRRRISRRLWRYGRPKRVRHEGRRFVHTYHHRRGGILDYTVHRNAEIDGESRR